MRWHEAPDGVQARLNDVLIDTYAADEPRGYPTLCKGRFLVDGQRGYALEVPTSLNTLALLPRLVDMGIAAIKIEGRQRSAAYVEQVTKVWRAAIDRAVGERPYDIQPDWTETLAHHAEGQQQTLGAYDRPWR